MPTEFTGDSSTSATAGEWARSKVSEAQLSLDFDTDGCANVEEACAGTLYDDLDQGC